MELVCYADRIWQCLDELSDIQTLPYGVARTLCIQYPAAEAVETFGIEGLINIFLQREIFVSIMERAFLCGHESRAHGCSFGPKSKRSGKAPAIGNSASCYDRNIDC
jgi:hypothetical protein